MTVGPDPYGRAMRLLHTSDWHLGRGLHGADLHEAQQVVLRRLVELVDEQRVDVVVVAGDVYDRAVPPVASVRLLAEALEGLSRQVPVLLISGNHDSADRLGFGTRLYRDTLHVRTGTAGVGRPVELADDHGPVLLYALPFLDPDFARVELAGGEEPLERSHQAVLGAAMAAVRADLAERSAASSRPVRSVVVAHAFVVGSGEDAETSDSERDIRVGGTDAVPSSVFAGVDYVALGHLHGAQQPASPDARTLLRYAGSPLRYSFSEAQQQKSVTLVELDASGVAGIEVLPIEQPRGMSLLLGPLDELLTSQRYAVAEEHWVQVSVTDAARPSEMVARIKERFPFALTVRHTPQSGPLLERHRPTPNAAADPLEVAESFVEFVTGGEATAAELDAFRDAYERVQSAGRAG